MQVGDLVRLKSSLDGMYRHCHSGQCLIYAGKGLWHDWGRFLLPDGTIGQIQLTDVEAVCK